MGDSYLSGEHRLKGRVMVITIITGVFLLFYLITLLNLQVAQGTLYKTRAAEVTQRSTVIPAMRGEFYDRNGDFPLVLNVDSFALKLTPAQVPEKGFPGLFSALEKAIGIPTTELERKIPPGMYRSFLDVELKDGLDYEVIANISEHIQDFPGISWSSKPKRSYVETGSLSHVIGYVGNITQEELQVLYNQGYNISSVLGKTGLEKKYDQILRGTDGNRYRTVDVRGKQVSSQVTEVPPVIGKDLVLTIDGRIQKLAEKALGERLGSVVVLKPATGEVLALVSFPFYDANIFYTDKASQEFTRLFSDRNLPFWNRAIQSEYPPASTFKLVMGAAILQQFQLDDGHTHLHPENQFVTCTGSIEIGDRFFGCWNKAGHGSMNLSRAIANSCNIYFYTAGYKYLNADLIAETARGFGLGQITGIDLPGESSGLVPTPKWKQRRMNYPWLGGDTVNMSIGQGFLTVSPLQLANMVSMIVNEGKTYRPHLIKEIRDRSTGKVVEVIKPEILMESGLSADIFQHIQKDMRDVVTIGTVRGALTTKAVQVAGKTGTGEAGIKGSNNHGWFVSFGPYDAVNPEDKVVVVVQVEAENLVDDWWAPKAADIIYQGIFANQSYDEVKEIHRPRYLR